MSRDDERIVAKFWPDWELGDSLGEGSFGTVYGVKRHSEYGPDVEAAVKVIKIPMLKSDVGARRLQGMSDDEIRAFYRKQMDDISDEVRIMQSLVGVPNVVVIHDYQIHEQDDGFGWIVGIRMERLEPLDDHFARVGIPSEREVARVGIDICSALAVCHEQHIIHRDVKPANVFFREAGEHYALGDFGIARQVQRDSSTRLSQRGTPYFMAPELYHGEQYGTNIDVYSLGVMLYRYLNHLRYPFCPPFPEQLGTNDEELANKQRLNKAPMEPIRGVNENLSAIVCKACDPNPKTRYQTANELRKDLLAWLDHPNRPVVHSTVLVEELDQQDDVDSREKTPPLRVDTNPEHDGGSTGPGGTRTVDIRTKHPIDPPTPVPTPAPTPIKNPLVAKVLIVACALLLATIAVLGGKLLEGQNSGDSGPTNKSEAGETTTQESNETARVDEILSKAKDKAKQEDYAGAVGVIEAGLIEYPNNMVLSDMKEEYERKKRDKEEEEREKREKEAQEKAEKEAQEKAEKERQQRKQTETTPEPFDNRSVTPSTFARSWNGSYVGVFARADGSEYQEDRGFAVNFSSVSEGGSVYGVCELTTGESYEVSGSIDWNTGYIEFQNVGWIVQKGTNSYRVFRGTVSGSGMSGTTTTTSGGHESNFTAHAV